MSTLSATYLQVIADAVALLYFGMWMFFLLLLIGGAL